MLAPDWLDDEARDLWQTVTLSRPTDYFDAGSAPLLESFVVLATHARALLRQLVDADPATPACARLERRHAAVLRTLGTLASRLRLSVQARVDRRSGQVGEKGAGTDDPLIGGRA